MAVTTTVYNPSWVGTPEICPPTVLTLKPGGKPAAYRSVNGGKSWQRQATGLPKAQAWLTVKRQAMTADQGTPLGVYFGTSSGEVRTLPQCSR